MPDRPKPPTASDAPEGMSATASAAVATTLSAGRSASAAAAAGSLLDTAATLTNGVDHEQIESLACLVCSVSVGSGELVEPVTLTATTVGSSLPTITCSVPPREASAVTVDPGMAAPRVRPDSSYAGSCSTVVVV